MERLNPSPKKGRSMLSSPGSVGRRCSQRRCRSRRHPEPRDNWLLHQSPRDQAAMLGMAVGDGCIGRASVYRGTMEKDTRASGDRRPKAPALPGTESDPF
jgi:hypothetical protein